MVDHSSGFEVHHAAHQTCLDDATDAGYPPAIAIDQDTRRCAIMGSESTGIVMASFGWGT